MTDSEDFVRPQKPRWEELQARVNKSLIRPTVIVRPLGQRMKCAELSTDLQEPLMIRKVLLLVFRYLPIHDLLSVMQVCKTWAEFAIDPSLWKTVKLNHKRLKPVHLMGIVRRQPDNLDLSWTKMNKDQMTWLLVRLPQLRKLCLSGQCWETVQSLASVFCPPLISLDISFCKDLRDATLNALLSTPRRVHSFHADLTTRLSRLTELSIAGTQVGDDGIMAIIKFLPSLRSLDVSSCTYITEWSVAILSHPSTSLKKTLSSLDLRGCNNLSNACLTYLEFLPALTCLRLHPCRLISLWTIRMWGRENNLVLDKEKVLRRNLASTDSGC